MRVVLASNNPHKLEELRPLLEGSPIELVLPSQRIEVDETGTSFRDNARLKARTYARLLGEPSLADDSGLAVDAMDGRPGVRSARYAGPSATDADRVNKLLAELKDLPFEKRDASFHCALAIVWPEGDELIVEGIVNGKITSAPQGDNGFGYDPVFLVNGVNKTFAEMSQTEKNGMSHRARAAELLVEALNHAAAGR